MVKNEESQITSNGIRFINDNVILNKLVNILLYYC